MSFWYLPIIISALLIPVFWLIISHIYNKAYTGNNPVKFLNLCSARLAHTYSDYFDFSENLLGVKCHLIIKFIVFLICSLITHFSESIIVSNLIMVAVLAIHMNMFRLRTRDYKLIIRNDESSKDVLSPIYKSYTCVTVYQIIVFIANLIVYILT